MWISADAYQEDPGIIHRVRMEVESLWQWTNAHIVASSSNLIDILGPLDYALGVFAYPIKYLLWLIPKLYVAASCWPTLSVTLLSPKHSSFSPRATCVTSFGVLQVP